MDKPIVSVIAPVYNSAAFIEESIQSVLNQNYPHIEYIVMDGGSTDGTVEIARHYSDRLTLISEPDNGQSNAINKGWKRAKGDILAWLNADDLYYPDTVETAVNYLQKHPETMWLYGQANFTDVTGEIGYYRHPVFPWDYDKLLTFGCYIPQPTVFLRRQVIEQFGYLDETLNFGMDYEYWLRIGKTYPAAYVPEVRVQVKIFQATKSRSGGYKRLQELEKMLNRYGAATLPHTMRHQWVEAMLSQGDLLRMWRFPRYVVWGVTKWLTRKFVPYRLERQIRQWLVRL